MENYRYIMIPTIDYNIWVCLQLGAPQNLPNIVIFNGQTNGFVVPSFEKQLYYL